MQAIAQLLVALIGLLVFLWVLGPWLAIGLGLLWLLMQVAGGDKQD